jgi:hypothetical protein
MEDISDLVENPDTTFEGEDIGDLVEGQQGSGPIGAALEAGGRSAMVSSGTMVGAALGLKAGTAAAPFLGPLAPAGPLGGMIAGGVAGYFAGDTAADATGLRPPEQMPPEDRAAAYFGESLGGSLGAMALPYGLAVTGYKSGGSMVGRWLDNVVNTAKTRPILFGVSEVSSAVSSAIAAGTAEAVAPGQTGVRIGAEIAGGILNPTARAIQLGGYAKQTIMTRVPGFNKAALQTSAGKKLVDIMELTGEDPSVVARIMRQQGVIDDVPLTAAQKTGSPALGAVQQHISNIDRQFGKEAAKKAEDAYDAIRGQINLLVGTGDPTAIATATELRAAYFRNMFDEKIKMATNTAVQKAGRITKDTPEVREKLSIAARESLEKVLEDSRVVEKQLWDKVPGDRPVLITNVETTFDDIMQDTLPELRGKKMPAVVKNFIDRINKVSDESARILDVDGRPIVSNPDVGGSTNIGEMRKLRSELLAMSRAAARDPDQVGMERIYNQLAEATMDDIDTAMKAVRDPSYDEARTFTRELNDTFTRSFAGKVVAEGKYGDRVAPEILLRKALATGKEIGALQLAELEEATRFLATKGYGDDAAHKVMIDSQERIFRLAAADAVDPATGIAKPERVAKFIKDNPTLLKRFPEIKTELQDAVKSGARLQQLTNRAKGVEDILARQGEFSKLLGASGVDPAKRADVARKAADRVLVSANQEAELTKLIALAKGGGTGRGGRITVTPEAATDGLRAALFNSVVEKSRNKQDGVLNLEMVKGFMFTPTTMGGKPLSTVMVEQGVMKPEEVTQMRRLFDMMSSIQKASDPGTAMNVAPQMGDAITTFFAKVMGSRLASKFQRVTGGGSAASLIIHGETSKLMNNIANKLPAANVNKMMAQLMNNPEQMARVMEKVTTPEQAARQARQLHAWLVQSGLTGVTDLGRDYEQQPDAPQMFSAPR